MMKDEKTSLTERTICTRSLPTSTSASVEPVPRRSIRGTPSKKPITPPSSTRNSERLAPSPGSQRSDKRLAPSPASQRSDKRLAPSPASQRSDKRLAPSPASQRSNKGNNMLSRNPKGSGTSGTNADTSPECEQRKSIKKNSIEESTDKIKKREPVMSARSFRALLRRKLEQSEAIVHASSNNEEPLVVECSRRVPADSAESKWPREISLEKVVPLKSIKDTEKMVRDASPIVETGDDRPSGNSETQKLVSKTSLETDIDFPLKRKRDTIGIVLDTCATVANGDDCVMSSDAILPSPSGCRSNNQSVTCSTSEKRPKVNGDLENLCVSPCIAQPVQESYHVAEDTKETRSTTSRGDGKNSQNMLQDKSYYPKLHSSMYPEYWIPVQLSGVQLEQYCRTLFFNSSSLSSPSKNDLVGALEETLVSVRKTCDHPYVMDASLKQLLTKNLEVHETLDVEVKASGKFHLLGAMLNQVKKNGLKAVVFYQATQSTGGLLLGNMLEDFVGQRFGHKSYEHGICSTKKNAINNFNKESQCFVLLLEKRACSQSIKLLRAEAFILFGSSLNPSHDVKQVEKIKVDSYSEKTKIFRLYSTFTVEERALILARKNKPVENLNRPLMHALLMWGASYLFDKLDYFHGSGTWDSRVSFEQSIVGSVINEFSYILSSKDEKADEGKLRLLLKAKHAHGTYHTGSSLFGEEHVKLSDEDSPNIFWKKLLDGKNPIWKYHSETPQRNRKRIHYFKDSEESEEISRGENTKRQKKASDDVTDPPVVDSPGDNDERKASEEEHMGALESPKLAALQSSGISPSGTLNGNDAFGLYSMGGHISGIPEDMLGGKDWSQTPCESLRSLHAVLKTEMAKLGKVLDLSENWTSMVEKFLDYVIENHHVCEEPVTTLQAFQIALSWIAASLVKHKFNREESLLRAKSELAFKCSREEVDYIYSMLYCMKSLFLESAQGLQLDCFVTNSKQLMVSMKQGNGSLSEGEECMTEKRGNHYSRATEDINKTISDIKKKGKKKEQKLVETHEKNKVELVNRFADKKRELETKKRLEAAVVRITCSRISAQSLGDDLKRLDHNYERESDKITTEKEKCLQSLEQMHEAAKKKLAEDQACWISRIEKWAQAEFKKYVPIKSGYNKHFCGVSSSNTSKNASDVQTCNNVNGETICADTTCMVSEGNQVPEAENTLGTLPGESIQQFYEIVASANDQAMDISTLSREQPAINQSKEQASMPEILIPASCQGEAALNVNLSEHQTSDRMTSVAEDEDVSSKVPEISQSFANLAKSASSELSLNREEALVTIENDRTSHIDSDADKTLDQQNEQACSLDKEIPEEVALPMPQPAFVVETRDSAQFDQDDQDICLTSSSPAEKQPDPASNIQGHSFEAAIASETVEAGGFVALEQGDQVTCPLPSPPAGIQPNPAAIIEGQYIERSAELYIAGPDAGEISNTAESDQETMGPRDSCSLPSALVGTQSDLSANIEGQNITTVAQLHTAGSDAVETGGSAISDQGAQDASSLPSCTPGNHPDAAVNIEGHNNATVTEPHTTGSDASPLPFSQEDRPDTTLNSEGLNNTTVAEPHTTGSDACEMEIAEPDASSLPSCTRENHPDAAVNIEGHYNTTVAEPHTTESDACEMEIAEPGPQVEQSTFTNNLVHEGGVEPSAAVTAPAPSLHSNSAGQSTVQPFPYIPFPVFNDPFSHELEKLRRESENTKKTFEEEKSILKTEFERKMAEVQAEYQRKFKEVEAKHNTRVMENEKQKNLVIMNRLLANAFLSKCNDKNVSHPSATLRGRIQQLALRAAQVSALRNAPAPPPPPVPLQPQASSFPSSVPRPPGLPLHSTLCPMPQPRQPDIFNTAPAPSASLATSPALNARLPSPAPNLNAYRSSSSIPTDTATQTSSPLPQALAYSAVSVQQQQQHILSSGLPDDNNDVVCLSDDD